MENENLPDKLNSKCQPASTATSETIITIEPEVFPVHVTPLATAMSEQIKVDNANLADQREKVRDIKSNLETKNSPPNCTRKSASTSPPTLLSPMAANAGSSVASRGSTSSIDQSRHHETQKKSGKSSMSRLLSGSGSCLVSSTGTQSEEKLNSKIPEGKMVTPRRHPRTNIKGLPLESSNLKLSRNFRQPLALSSALKAGPKERPSEQHCFLTDVADVRQMEQGLLQLLDDFHSGKLQAFGQDCTVEKMEQVREQQERLARLHFDLNSGQEVVGPQTNEGRQMAKENLPKLIESLHQLSLSIEQLQSTGPGVQTQV